MRVATALVLATAPLAMANIIAEAVEKAALVTRQASGLFDVSLIPSVCTDQCTTYTSVFGTCPTDPSAAVCQTACNGTVLNEFIACTGCLVTNGPAAGMEQWQIDILNIAQQQQAQKCVDAAYPATFTGAVTTPTTVSYPAGVANATYISTSKSAASVTPTSSRTSAAASSASAASSTTSTSAAKDMKPAGALAVVLAVMGAAALC